MPCLFHSGFCCWLNCTLRHSYYCTVNWRCCSHSPRCLTGVYFLNGVGPRSPLSASGCPGGFQYLACPDLYGSDCYSAGGQSWTWVGACLTLLTCSYFKLSAGPCSAVFGPAGPASYSRRTSLSQPPASSPSLGTSCGPRPLCAEDASVVGHSAPYCSDYYRGHVSTNWFHRFLTGARPSLFLLV